MKRPWQIWLVYVGCLGLLLAAAALITVMALRAEGSELAARQMADREERIRLALWRMDSAVAPLIAQESTAPYFAYASFFPAERAYTRMLQEMREGEVLFPSPLMVERTPGVRVHFQLDADGTLMAPEVPTDDMRAVALDGFTTEARIAAAEASLAALRPLLHYERLVAALPAPVAGETRRVVRGGVAAPQAGLGQALEQPQQQQQHQTSQTLAIQSEMNLNEMAARGRLQQQVADNRLGNAYPAVSKMDGAGDVRVGLCEPLWLGPELILARRVQANGAQLIQGCLLDWPALRATLVAEVVDLLPGAVLQPLAADASAERSRRLATLPVQLLPGEVPAAGVAGDSPLRVALVLAWGALLLAALAVTALLFGAVSLSERRAAFVSAVTHEMRTPLTTFRMYTEMLANGMLTDEGKRQRYLGTLHSESERLSHLVENVLSFARLERGRRSEAATRVTVAELLERVLPRLRRRAEQAGLEVVTDIGSEVAATEVMVDVPIVEQILLNLVDNACKYAADGEPPVIQLGITADDRQLRLRVRDHGPGIDAQERRRIFRPFHKSAQQAAHSAPGVGLGLALSRRLARMSGGELRLVEGEAESAVAPGGGEEQDVGVNDALREGGGAGAVFELLLPRG